MSSHIEYEDQWGEIIRRPESKLVEIRWYDTTSGMSGDAFSDWLSIYAGCVEAARLPNCLVDAVQFKMPPANMNMGWRDQRIIPRYNAANVQKFAFVMPQGMPLIGEAPGPEGPANFPTGYFGQRAQAGAWLNQR